MSEKLYINPFCLAFGHNYFRRINFKTNKEEIVCKSCYKEFRYSIAGNIVEIPPKHYSLLSEREFKKA